MKDKGWEVIGVRPDMPAFQPIELLLATRNNGYSHAGLFYEIDRKRESVWEPIRKGLCRGSIVLLADGRWLEGS